jgi:hypothetical protein
VHFVNDDAAAIAEGVDAVIRDLDYRRHLETGARDWFERHLAPGRVVRRMLDHAAWGVYR